MKFDLIIIAFCCCVTWFVLQNQANGDGVVDDYGVAEARKKAESRGIYLDEDATFTDLLDARDEYYSKDGETFHGHEGGEKNHSHEAGKTSKPGIFASVKEWLGNGNKNGQSNQSNQSNYDSDKVKKYAYKLGKAYGFSKQLIHNWITQESAWKVKAVSSAGAVGLTQVMPATAKKHCNLSKSQLLDAYLNIKCGISYLNWCKIEFNTTKLALACYNAGPNAVRRYGNKVPPFKETKKYIRNILG